MFYKVGDLFQTLTKLNVFLLINNDIERHRYEFFVPTFLNSKKNVFYTYSQFDYLINQKLMILIAKHKTS